MLTSSPVPPSSSSARVSGLRRKKPSHHTRRPPPSRAVSMFSSLKSLVTTPLSWFANTGNDTFESEDTPGKRKLVHGSSRPYDSDGEQHDTPSAYRVKRIRLNSPERVASPVPHPAPYLDPPTPSLRASTLPRNYAPKSTRPYTSSSNRITIPLPDTSRLSPLSNPPRTHAAAISRTMSMDPPTARRPSVPLPLPISRDVSMEFSPNLSAEPPNPPFRMRSALTPQPGAPLYGPNPQRRERNPSEPPPLTTLIENPIFVKPPSVPQEPRRVSNDSSSLTLGSLVGAQKSGLATHRSHSTLVLPSQSSNGKSGSCFRPTNSAELAFQELEKYRTPLLPSRLGSANIDGALPELFQTRKKARALVLMKRDNRDDKPRLGHASKYISARKEKEKETPSKSKNSKPYAGEGGLKRLLARRKQEELDAEPTEDADAQQMVDDSELEPVPPKRTSKIAEPVRAPATFARKVSAPPTSVPSFGMAGGRKPTSLRASRTHANSRTVGPTRNRNRFSAAYEDDEPDDVDDPGAVLEEPPKDKEVISGLPKFEAPSGFSFAPPPSVASIPQASDTPSVHDELPITTLPFTFSKVPSVPSPTPAPVASALQPPVIAVVPPTPLAEKPLPEPALPNFFANSQIFARTGVPPPQTEPKPSVSGTTAPDSQTVPNPPASIFGTFTPSTLASASSPESQKPTQPALPTRATSIFGPPAQAQSMPTSSTQSSNTSSLPFSLTPSSTSQPTEKKDASPAPQKPLFGGAMNSFRGFGSSSPASVTTAPAPPSTPAKSLFSFGAPSTTPAAPVEKPGAAPSSFTFSSTTPTSAPSGFLFGSLAAQSETKPATGSGFSYGTPGPASSDTSKPAFSFGTSTPARPLTPPSTEDGMRMEESPTRGGGVDANGGSAKPQSLPQLQMPGKAGFTFSTNTGTAFGSALPSPFGATPTTSLAFGQQNQATSQGTSGGFAFNANPKSSEGASGGFSFGTTKPAENTAPTGFAFGQSTTESRPSSSSGFAFNQPGPKTADATSSGFSFKAPESIQHSTSFTFGQAAPEPARTTSSSGFAFGQPQAPAQTPAAASPFAFGSSVNSGAFGSAPASPAFATQPLAPTSAAPFSFGGPTSAPPQQPASNPFGFGSGAGQPTSPAVQQGFGFNFGGGTPQTPTGTFGASTPQTPTTGNSGNPVFTMGGAAPTPSGTRLMRKLPRRPNGKR
ncbi:hypothetical protein V8E53_013711 [Lactarius tabidus]